MTGYEARHNAQSSLFWRCVRSLVVIQTKLTVDISMQMKWWFCSLSLQGASHCGSKHDKLQLLLPSHLCACRRDVQAPRQAHHAVPSYPEQCRVSMLSCCHPGVASCGCPPETQCASRAESGLCVQLFCSLGPRYGTFCLGWSLLSSIERYVVRVGPVCWLCPLFFICLGVVEVAFGAMPSLSFIAVRCVCFSRPCRL
jgi:hypothetical protein